MVRRKKPLFTPLRVTLALVLLTIIVVAVFWILLDGKDIPVLNPQGVIARQQLDLIQFTLLLSCVVVIPVFVMLGVISWKYRVSKTDSKYTPDADGNKWLELLWWGIPIIIIGILCVVTWVSTHQLDPYKPIASNVKPISVQVVALQWKWLFIYPEQGVASVNVLKIPAGTPVNFQLTADGPMSSMWIPSLGSQIYAMSGMSTRLSLMADNPGEYRGSNTNISGTGYADMHFMTEVMPTRKAFDYWVNAVEENASHNHIDMTEYTELAKPSRNNSPAYYHLHDKELYNQILDKYMNHSSTKHNQTASHEGEHSEGGGN